MINKITTETINIDDIKEIVIYHKNLFGVKTDLLDEAYLSIKHEMFNMINLFTLLDDEFEDFTLSLLIKDVLSLIFYFDNLDIKIKMLMDEDDIKEYKKIREKIVPIINTKMYYLDLYIWKRVEISREVQYYLRQKFNSSVHNIFDFLTYRKNSFKTAIDMKYDIKDIDTKVKYNKKDIDTIIALDILETESKNELLQKLIDRKNSIKFFKNMKSYDIKSVVKDIEFLRYGKGETIINEGELCKEVYFVLSGICDVKIDNKYIATIEKNQLFGEFSAILDEPRTATVISQYSTTVIRFNFAFELFNLEPHPFTLLYKNIIDELIKKIAKANKRR